MDKGRVDLTNEEIQRYSRHLLLPEFGVAGQQKLKRSSVLIVGAGGLGSPLALYLAAAGVGRLGIIDFDVVDRTNLARQIMHTSNDVDRLKVDSARDRIHALNPNVSLQTFSDRLTSVNAREVVRQFDVVADGTDNFPTRYLVNDTSVLEGVPNVYGSIFRFEGQVSVFGAGDGPCYRCLYPKPPPPELVPSCAEGGVLGVLPGIVGSIMALEVIKLLTGIGDTLVGRLLLVNTKGMQFESIGVKRNPQCLICGDAPSITELIDYEDFCGVASGSVSSTTQPIPEILPVDLKARMESGDTDFILVDVRKPNEYQIANLDGTLIPLHELNDRVGELDDYRDRDVILYCRSGVRSARAVEILQQHGFPSVYNLKGGMLAWTKDVDPRVPIY
ncbi:MAG: molybdopterin-synthase adenylyltransferase MoeB [Rhodothermales bacterium]|nr:molybdopterin-synthase adenylyltransferase MoeB [Rhodothermales bacterium]